MSQMSALKRMSQGQAPKAPKAASTASMKAARAAARLVRDPNFECRTGIYDQLRMKCAANTASCKGTRDDGTMHSYSDCEKYGSTAANLLTKFPTSPEDNKSLKEMLRAEKNSGDPAKSQYDLGMAKKCLTQLWYTPEQGQAELMKCAPPKRSSKKPASASRPKGSLVKSAPKGSVKANANAARPFF